MPRALTADDATVLKLTLFALLERYSTFNRTDLDEMNDLTPTPSGPVDETMDTINRVRIDGKAVVRTERAIDKGKPFYELHYPFSEDDFPGDRGPSAWRSACACRNSSECRYPMTSAPNPPRRASTKQPSSGWPPPSRSLTPPRWCTDGGRREETRAEQQLRSSGSPRGSPDASAPSSSGSPVESEANCPKNPHLAPSGTYQPTAPRRTQRVGKGAERKRSQAAYRQAECKRSPRTAAPSRRPPSGKESAPSSKSSVAERTAIRRRHARRPTAAGAHREEHRPRDHRAYRPEKAPALRQDHPRTGKHRVERHIRRHRARGPYQYSPSVPARERGKKITHAGNQMAEFGV